MIKTAAELLEELRKLGVQTLSNPRDSKFYCPTVEWLKKFGLWFKKNIKQKWTNEKFDCDDFAIRAVDRATDSLGAEDSIQNCGHSFCFAEVYLATGATILGIEGPGKHAVNLVRTTKGWYYFEPQMGTFCPVVDLIADESLAVIFWVWL